MTKEQKLTGLGSAPDWAPDNCPPDVVSLIDDDQYLQDMGLRGLSSADSKEVHQAVRHLKGQFAGVFQTGRRSMADELATKAPRRTLKLMALAYAVGVIFGVVVAQVVM